MKIVSFMCVYNDWEFLDQAIAAFKDYPDKLYIIEGSWKSSQKFGVSPRSDEETYRIINKHVDDKKVFLIQANEDRERNQRQLGLELAKKEGADWCHMLDADEVYTSANLHMLKNILKGTAANQDILGYRLRSYNFINSFKKWYDGNYMRIYRVTPEAHFYMDNDVSWGSRDSRYGIVTLEGKKFYHYNYVKLNNSAAFWLKMKYQNEQDPTFWSRYVSNGQYKESQGKYKIPDDIKIYDYIGKHPIIMKDHPYFVNDVFKDGELQYE